jgi:hypothetical protein
VIWLTWVWREESEVEVTRVAIFLRWLALFSFHYNKTKVIGYGCVAITFAVPWCIAFQRHKACWLGLPIVRISFRTVLILSFVYVIKWTLIPDSKNSVNSTPCVSS